MEINKSLGEDDMEFVTHCTDVHNEHTDINDDECGDVEDTETVGCSLPSRKNMFVNFNSLEEMNCASRVVNSLLHIRHMGMGAWVFILRWNWILEDWASNDDHKLDDKNQ